jgi:hypothetical protein
MPKDQSKVATKVMLCIPPALEADALLHLKEQGFILEKLEHKPDYTSVNMMRPSHTGNKLLHYAFIIDANGGISQLTKGFKEDNAVCRN